MNFRKVYILIQLIILPLAAFANFLQRANNPVDTIGYQNSYNFSRPLKVIEKNIDNKKAFSRPTTVRKTSVQTFSDSTINLLKTNTNYKKFDVGAIDESCHINPNGSSTVNVTIDLPQSPFSFQPTLSLCYNSMSMVGNMGWGWSIMGNSYISKTSKTIYFDGTTESPAIANDTTCAFSLDGIRLIKQGSSSTCIHYESVKGQILVNAIHNNGTIISFEAKYPNGNIAFFRKHSANHYYISEAIDPRGQHIYYNYSPSEQGLLLTDIYYAHNRYRVNFNYKLCSEMSDVVYDFGEERIYNNLLSGINITIDSHLWRQYTIDYEKKNEANLVSQISCKDSHGKALPPLLFKYGNNEINRSFNTLKGQLTKFFPYEKNSDIIAQKCKFQYGIASEGIIIYPNYIPNIEMYQHSTAFRHSTHYFSNQFSENQEIIVAKGLEDDLSFDCGKLTAGKGFNGIICADIDKTQGDEIIKFNDYLSGDKDILQITAYNPSIYGGLTEKYQFRQSFNNQFVDAKGHGSIYPKNFYVGDFTGDGVNEILAIMPSNLFGTKNLTKLYLIDISNNKVLYNGDAPFSYTLQYCRYNAGNGKTMVSSTDAAKNSDLLFIMDIDGDGKSEIVHIDENGTSTYAFNWSTSNNIKCTKIYYDNILKKEDIQDHNIYQAQLNSDNLIDFAITPDTGKSNWKIFLSMGNGKFRKKNINYPTLYNQQNNYFFQDINLDGKSDLVEYRDDETIMKIHITSNIIQPKETLTSNIEKNTLIIPARISSYNWTSSLFSIDSHGEIKKYIFQENDFNNKLLVGYTNSFGVAKHFSYQNLYSSQYLAGNNAQFPFINYIGPLQMVTNFKVETNSKVLSDITYRYNNAIVHKQGLGLRGFEYIQLNDKITGNSSWTKFDVFHQGNILQADDTSSSIIYEYDINIDKNKIDRSVLRKRSTKYKSNNISKTEDFEYDQKLNITKQITDYGNGYSKTDKFEYISPNDNKKYILGLLSKEEHKVNRNGSTEILSTNYVYNNNMIKEKKININGNLASTESYDYNSDGQGTNITINSFDSPIKHTTTFTFNKNGLISSKTGDNGLTQSYKYDELDRLTSSCDYKGTIDYTYDGWGNIRSCIKSDSTRILNLSSWSDGEAGSIFKIELQETGKPNTLKFYNELGQLVREGSCHYDGNYLFVDKEYDDKGHIISLSQPFKHSCPVKKYHYQYDKYGRISYTETPKGIINTYSYNDLEVTIDENGKLTSRTYNVFNDLISVNSYKGNITYHYDGGGRITEEITGSTTLSYKYDNFGRQTEETSPYSGTKEIRYDTDGNVAEENDGEYSTYYSYDSLRQNVIKKSDKYQTFNYSYNLYGELIEINSIDGKLSKSYNYDNKHRLKTITERISDKTFTQTFNYANGHIASINYKSSNGLDVTEKYIYENNVLAEVKLNENTTIWQLKEEDDQGKACRFVSLGNEAKYTYDDNNNLSSIGVYRNGKLLWKEDYQFDNTGSLIYRNNHHRLEEIFKYDDMDRLVSINNRHITYDEVGNIMTREQVGQYNYNSIRPYELESLTSTTEESSLQCNQRISYNSTLQPLYIDNDSIKSEFTYAADGHRATMKVYDAYDSLMKTKYYFGNKYEIIETPNETVERLFLVGDAYDSPTVLVRNYDGEQIYQITHDYQGSIKAIFDINGNLIQELSFDPWGRGQNPQTGTFNTLHNTPHLFLDRGYTGHEHLREYQLINMNGRLYNPILGRFLSPDPILADNTNPLNYNCYAYALNNPLKYVDKNGKNPLIFIGAIVGLYLGGSMANHNFNPVKWDWHSTTTYFGMIVGGLTGGAAGYGISSGFFNFKFALSTPFIAVGITWATNEQRKDTWNIEYSTVAGGEFDYGSYKAEKNANRAYNKATTSIRNFYTFLQSDLSNTSLNNFSKDWFDGLCSWGEKNLNAPGAYSTNIFDLKWYDSVKSVPKGVRAISCTELGRDICRYGGKASNYCDLIILGIDLTDMDKNYTEREKWESYGSKIGSFAGSFIGGSIAMGLSGGTGPIAIPLTVLGSKIGEVGLGAICKFGGGIAYDISELIRINSYLNNLGTSSYPLNTNIWEYGF